MRSGEKENKGLDSKSFSVTLRTAITETINNQTPDDAGWRKIRFMVFDLPEHPGSFTERNEALKTLLAGAPLPWVRQVEQLKVADHVQLRAMLDRVMKKGGEGLMLHRGVPFIAPGAATTCSS